MYILVVRAHQVRISSFRIYLVRSKNECHNLLESMESHVSGMGMDVGGTAKPKGQADDASRQFRVHDTLAPQLKS